MIIGAEMGSNISTTNLGNMSQWRLPDNGIFTNLSQPSKWTVPEGEGIFKNLNHPSEWCLNPFGGCD